MWSTVPNIIKKDIRIPWIYDDVLQYVFQPQRDAQRLQDSGYAWQRSHTVSQRQTESRHDHTKLLKYQDTYVQILSSSEDAELKPSPVCSSSPADIFIGI